MNIIALTVCVNYYDILKHMLKQNSKFFEKWYIITLHVDTNTINLIEKSNIKNLNILYYNNFYINSNFNKGAIRFGQEHVEKYHTNSNILILDPDIYLPDNFFKKIPDNIEKYVLYNVSDKIEYWSLDDFINETNSHEYIPKINFNSFFQLYNKCHYKYNNYDDNDFKNNFIKKINLDISVKQLKHEVLNIINNDIIALTVCVNYNDILEQMLKQNSQFFNKWYIVTSETDNNTINLIQNSKIENITILYYNNFFTNSIFNKGGAVRFGQEYLEKYHNNANIIILDADIYLPDNFKQKFPDNVRDYVLYGVTNRIDYWTLYDFKNETNPHEYKHGHNFVGFFQLYKKCHYKYNNSDNCSTCDDEFRDTFTKKINLDITVKHLGREEVNWNGRNNNYSIYTNDIIDEKPKIEDTIIVKEERKKISKKSKTILRRFILK